MEHISLAGLEVSRLGRTAIAPPAGDRYANMSEIGR
jgi:hypothetical protein